MSTNINRTSFASLLLLLSAVVALGSAYGSQYLGDLQPCKLCLYQRWPWWIAGGMAGLVFLFGGPRGAGRQTGETVRRHALILIAMALLAGCAIATYHTGVEQHWWEGPATCSGGFTLPKTLEELHTNVQRAVTVRCDESPWSLWGISMAGYNAVASAVAGLFALNAGLRN
jgi:disulfide bond formation protein DsbB